MCELTAQVAADEMNQLGREQAGPPGTYSHLLTDIQKEAPLFCHNFSSFCVYDMGYEHLDGKIMCFSFLC